MYTCLRSANRLLTTVCSCLPWFCVVARGTTIEEQIVIGTPGTVLDWCLKLKFFDPKKISVFVLDEADIMIAMQGHCDQTVRIERQAQRPRTPFPHQESHCIMHFIHMPSSAARFGEKVILRLLWTILRLRYN